jgi:DNA-binding NarL/FixJ family response regulator
MPVRVFLVEDMQHVRGVLTDLLGSLGEFEIAGMAGTEAEARLWLAEHPDAWDLVTIDLVLDSGSGMGVIPTARKLADQHGGRIVVFSDYATEGIERHCRQLGADAVFTKSGEMRAFMDYCSELGGAALA